MLEEHNFAKGQRKRRLNREHSLQHHPRVKDNRSSHSLLHHHQSRRKDQTYTKRHRQKLLQASLENVSSHPHGDHKPPESTLRRSRSLAISRDDVFTNLEIHNASRARRRSQLIPRAKLIDRCNNSSSRSSLQRGLSHESLYTDHSTLSVLTRNGLDYAAVPQAQPGGFKYRDDISGSQYLPALSTLRHSTTDLDSLEHDAANYKPQPQQQQHSQVKHHHQHQQTTEDSGLSLPNYYPDSKCDTDISFTDNLSLSGGGGGFSRDSKYRQSSLYPESNTNISYDENIVLSKTQLYDKVEEHYIQSKPRTIRGNTPYYQQDAEANVKPRSLPNFGSTPVGAPVANSNGYESDSTLSDYDPKYYEPVEKLTSSDSNNDDAQLQLHNRQQQPQQVKQQQLQQQQQQRQRRSSDSQEERGVEEEPIIQELQPEKDAEQLYHTSGEPQQPIHHYHRIQAPHSLQPQYHQSYQHQHHQPPQHHHYQQLQSLQYHPHYQHHHQHHQHVYGDSVQHYEEAKSEFSNIEANPIYDEIPVSAADRDLIKTSIQVPCEDEPEAFKTVVSVQPDHQQKTNTATATTTSTSDEDDVKEAKKHSHNYLKEFLETQKGSKKPLQNFLSKRISRAFNTSDNVPANPSSGNKVNKKSNLVENQYFSLPDITVSKNLQKCEKIDRKLRKCEKLAKSPSDVSTNRFIVNIGNHFDVTARSSIPVDFELKISKIPKQKKSAKNDKNFVDAVKSMNETLKPEVNPKVIVNGEEINTKDIYQRDKEVEVLIEDTKMSNAAEVSKEFQQKINTMRTYWGSMLGSKDVPQEEQRPDKPDGPKEAKCKIVGMQTKIDEVKMKFEVDKEKQSRENSEHDERQSKVQMTKQFFENNDAQLQKATTKQGLLENPYFDNQFESLNPNTLELIEQEDKYDKIQANVHENTYEVIRPIEHRPIHSIVQHPAPKETKVVIEPKEIKLKEVPTENLRKSEKSQKKPHSKLSLEPEFDHVRYRVVKSDLFQKKIFAKCEKESQFDGLMQYLQDYSFQELLIDNNIVIIEPIRTNIQYVGSNNAHHVNKVTKFIRTPGKPPISNESTGLRKHFFYHPIRVNREVNDDELPNPDTVKQVRQLFEGQMPRSQSSKHLDSLTKQTVQYIRPVDPDKDRCSASEGSSHLSGCEDDDDNEGPYDEENDVCCEYVSEDILEKIRERGTSVTYYGGRVTSKRKPPAMTKAIMDEIQNQKCNCRFKALQVVHGRDDAGRSGVINQCADGSVVSQEGTNSNSYQGVKFKLLKSNSCSSRLELVGTKNLSEYRKKFIIKQKQLLDEHNMKQQRKINEKNAMKETMLNSIPHNNPQHSAPEHYHHQSVQRGQTEFQGQNSHNGQNQHKSRKQNHQVPNQGQQYTMNLTNYSNSLGYIPTTQANKITVGGGAGENANQAASFGNNVSNGTLNINVINNHNNSKDKKQTPKIIGEEMKAKRLIQWGEMRDDNKTYSGITYTQNGHNYHQNGHQPNGHQNGHQKVVSNTNGTTNINQKTYDFFEKVKTKPKKVDEMEFEPYEIAN